MSLLQSIVTQVVQNAVAGNQPKQAEQQGGLGGMLGSMLGGQGGNSGLGGMLGNVVASQLGGQNSQSNSGLGGLLGGLLGGGQTQTRANPSDLGSILGSVLGSQSQAQSRSGGFKSTLLLALLPIVLGYIQKNGGLSGVLSKFQSNGLNDKAQSWMSVDANNDGIDAGDVMRLFGQDEIEHACQQTGANQDEVCQGIAELLPQVVNDLTPYGDLTSESQANEEISQILQQLGR